MDFIREIAPHYGDALGMPQFEPDLLLQEGDLKFYLQHNDCCPSKGTLLDARGLKLSKAE